MLHLKCSWEHVTKTLEHNAENFNSQFLGWKSSTFQCIIVFQPCCKIYLIIRFCGMLLRVKEETNRKRGAGSQQTHISVVTSGSGNDIQLMHTLFWASLCNIEYNMHDYMYCTAPAIACSITLPSLINSNISKFVECFPEFLFHKSAKQQWKNLIIEDTPNKNTPAIHTGLVQNHLIST
jgi:hypothetical protein